MINQLIPTQVFVITDYDLMRFAIYEALHLVPGIAIMGEANIHQIPARLGNNLRLDVIILGLAMPGTTGVEAARMISRIYAEIPLLILTTSNNVVEFQQSLAPGVEAYVTAEGDVQGMLQAIYSLTS